MSDHPPTDRPPPEADIKAPNRFALIWLVPLAAAAIAIYLGYETLASRGPMITITFANGQGLTAGQTHVQHNAIGIGTVESVTLSPDFRQVIAKIRMAKDATPMLTSHARFWVVRPRLSLTDISALQTLVSGSFIAIDPGPPGGTPQREFRGLDQPPGVISDQPGRTFTLRTPALGWLEPGAPVFYRDITVGRLLDFEEQGMGKPILLHVFVRAPYDEYVRTETHFWNVSGLTASFGPDGVHVAVESAEALVAGGINFANFEDAANAPPAGPDTVFQLYANFNEAQNAGFRDNIPFVTYFNQSVAGLAAGSAVQLYGIRVGTVTGTKLLINPDTGEPRVRVAFNVQPARVFAPTEIPRGDPFAVTQKMVDLGVRARIDMGNLVTGQEVIGLDIVSDAPKATLEREGDAIVWPSQGGGLQNLTDTASSILAKLNTVPLDKLGDNANELVATLKSLSATANDTLKPLSAELPELSRQLQTVLRESSRLMTSMQSGYGANSDTHQNLQLLTNQAAEALRSVRELTNYLNNHPGAVVWGRR
ncbi:MAG TPA: MlaD family protein [Rhodopila sp.]|nr:MlaD family protein [Rhodopila sp.]